jgi:hypothetical protein
MLWFEYEMSLQAHVLMVWSPIGGAILEGGGK